jgi:3-dehydroquinate synthase
MTSQHITLTGFSGSGKTTVARLVAQRLGWAAIDSDELIEQREGRSVPDIIAQQGEAAFRAIEAQVFDGIAGRDRVIVASGGGALVHGPTRRSIVDAGLVVHLSASLEATRANVAADANDRGRPLRSPRIFDERAPLYLLADFVVSTDVLTADEVAGEVLRLYQTYGDRALSRPDRADRLLRPPTILPQVVDAPGAAATIHTASGRYPAYVAWGALERLGDYTRRATGARRAFLISDSSVLSHWGETAVASLREAGLESASFALPPGDGSKSIDQAARAYDWLASHRAERRDAIVALGGGVAGDFGGFIAGTYLRGMPYVQAPTSLLAMVDASIGGKTAVNHAGAKNIVGLFNQPRAVIADVATLKTLSRRALVEGMGEVIKHAFIRDEQLLELLEQRLEAFMTLDDPELTASVIARNVQIKGDVVSEDERETGGVREILNYGHTLGHAFEAAGGYEALLHGEAVSVGMMAAAEIGRRVGLTPPGLVERQRELLERAGLPLQPPPGLSRDKVRGALALDKKIVAGGQRWVLLADIARPVVRDDVPATVVEAVLDELLAR